MSATVLIAEDNKAASSGLAEFLEGAGYQIRTATDGVEALARLDREPVDLMLLDIWMPRMDGIQLLRELKDRPSHPKVIVMNPPNCSS